MLVPEDSWIYAPYLVFDVRRVLAPVLPFSEMVHRNAYSIPSIAIDLGARVRYRDCDSPAIIGVCTRAGDATVITLNGAVEGTRWDMAALTHELGHAAVDEGTMGCLGSLRKLAERNAWLRGIYVAISRPLAEMVLDGHATIREIAGRCHVPDPIVGIRVSLAVALGDAEGDAEGAYELIRRDLLALEQWFDDGRARGFDEWAVA